MGYTLAELAEKVGGVVSGDHHYVVEKLGALENATIHELSFLANPKYQSQLATTSAGAVLVKTEELAALVANSIIVPNPHLAFAQLSHLFAPTTQGWSGIHPSAVISEGATVSKNAVIGPNAVIDDDVSVGDGCVVGAGCVLSRGVKLGKESILYPNVTVYHDVIIGDFCILHSGSVIGSDGFGFVPTESGWEKIEQIGTVELGNYVEIGASTAIDRGAIENTRIGNGVKIDNQVHIAHNVVVGDNTAIAGGTAIAGSTKIGSFCTISGGVGIGGHISIVDRVHITGMSMISHSITEEGSYSSGMGMEPTSKWRKTVARVRRIDEMAKQFSQLKKQVNEFLDKVDKK